MLRSRFLSINQLVLQRTVVTKAKSFAVNNENKEEEKQQDIKLDNSSSNMLYEPPRRPLKHQFTHQVTNQVPPLENVNLYETDLALQEFLTKENSGQMRNKKSFIKYVAVHEKKMAEFFMPVEHDEY